ncbi:hypothetical protein ACJRO7_007727 [Eucalyptus globulus]|uniref:GIR1-like zinc ribbon domain-containing protein n=1 Tax=Eucalyptus globulus TaxID=34317 RepID=A0ABD3IP29_EUCGL
MITDVQFGHQHCEVHGVISSIGSPYAGLNLSGIVRPSPIARKVELEEPYPLPLGWQKFLDLKTGEIYYTKAREDMSCRAAGSGTELDLKLNLSPPMVNPIMESPTESLTASPSSSSCLSLEVSSDEFSSLACSSDDGPAVMPMMLVGCQRCLMYVMISEEGYLECPKCKSTVLLDILHGKPKVLDYPKFDKKAS